MRWLKKLFGFGRKKKRGAAKKSGSSCKHGRITRGPRKGRCRKHAKR